MEGISGVDTPSSSSWLQLHRFAACLLATSLGAASNGAVAATYWQLQQSAVSVFAEGDKDTAKRVLETTLRLQSAARWLLTWPDSYREPPVLVVMVNERLLRSTFKYPPESNGAYTDATTGHESWARTPSLIVVVAPMGYAKGRELRSLQHAYGEALLRAEPSHDWPACVHLGMSMVFAAAELTAPNHFYLSGEKTLARFDIWNAEQDVWNPERLLTPANASREAQWELDRGGYSCFMLSFMIASASTEQRIALEKMLTAVGRGTALGAATMSELQQTKAEFTARYREFSTSAQVSWDLRQVRVEFPETIPVMPEPTPVSPEELHVLMGKLCGKLSNCRN